LIYFSSAAIYGTPKYLPIDENHPCEPDSPYGVSKLAGEKDVLCMSRISNFRAVCFRPFNVYGKNQRFDAYGNVIPIFFQKIFNNESINIYGDGEQTRDFINVKDIVKAVIHSLENDIIGIFNLATGKSITINQLVEYLRIATEEKLKVNYISPRAGEVKHSSADIKNLVSNFNFQPDLSLTELLKEYWEWFKIDQKEFKESIFNKC
jgi:nucleoside-diphosphate-sugar epimerase